ncbi:hypothetical protein FNV43_RR12889 [Rhamnella rubrinervis]|uniref:Trans-resveratrol di-O-methyltransferase-like n=1 Tax=Rhamnella rubrinervis TaxID=2594499 RepID=A0A8K0H071_9ROSA|nr:hypothetical protein FNV43_RR12889 [Rhamnella rubrinervis]
MDLSYEMYSSSELLDAQAHVWNTAYNFISSMSLKCAIELGIPDIIHNNGQPLLFSKLIESLPIHPSKAHCIRRLMRLLVHSGFFAIQQQQDQEEEEEEQYSLTLPSKLLVKEGSLNMAPLLLTNLDPVFTTSWHFLSTWFQKKDSTVFETTHKRTMWDFAALDTSFNSKLNELMASDSKLIAKILLREYKEVFEGVKSLVDVAGGTGTMAKAIACTFPLMNCTVFDLPHVVADLKASENLNFIGGNMFEAIPPANAILLKWILHDWNDEDCVTILKNVKKQFPRKMKVDKKSTETQLYFDVLMMAETSGKERNQTEWEKLFLAAGFSDYKVTPLFGLRSLIEVYP